MTSRDLIHESADENFDFSRPVEIAPGIYWVGIYIDNDPFQCHPYLIENGDESILIDPGSVIQKEKLIDKIKQVCDFTSIKYIILHHQDPDLCAAVPELEGLIGRQDLMIVTHSRMSILVKHYGLKSDYYNIDHHDFHLQAGSLSLDFLTTPYCHSPGAFVTYDARRKILFSGDIFGGLEESWKFYADENYYSHIEGFHMSYMPSRDILNYALRKIENLDIEIIAPQHGSLIKRKYIAGLIQQMKKMESGLYIDKEYSANLTDTIDQLNSLKNDLQISFDEISELKKQQDKDYFLMNLLANPLTRNSAESRVTRVDYFIYQKKRFRFNGSVRQIGGDYCSSGNLIFNGDTHTVFCNADSMGKSMQGAGGLLVVGTAMNSIINRSSGFDLPMAPRDWLTNTFNELQRLFLSFDESMMISCIVGCINDRTGHLSFINVEHPPLVLLRQGAASFIESQSVIRKIGCRDNGAPAVDEFMLQKGDVIFIGSDGKDDLKYACEDEAPMVNGDIDVFRAVVEKSSGDIKTIVTELVRRGEITDDLSLMKISYQAGTNQEPPFQAESLVEYLDNARIANLLKMRKYQEALEIIEILPENSVHALYLRGFCHYHQKRFLKARIELETLLGIRPDHALTLKLIGKVLVKLKNYDGAAEYWRRALDLNPGDHQLYENYNNVLKRLSRQKVLLGVKQGQKLST